MSIPVPTEGLTIPQGFNPIPIDREEIIHWNNEGYGSPEVTANILNETETEALWELTIQKAYNVTSEIYREEMGKSENERTGINLIIPPLGSIPLTARFVQKLMNEGLDGQDVDFSIFNFHYVFTDRTNPDNPPVDKFYTVKNGIMVELEKDKKFPGHTIMIEDIIDSVRTLYSIQQIFPDLNAFAPIAKGEGHGGSTFNNYFNVYSNGLQKPRLAFINNQDSIFLGEPSANIAIVVLNNWLMGGGMDGNKIIPADPNDDQYAIVETVERLLPIYIYMNEPIADQDAYIEHMQGLIPALKYDGEFFDRFKQLVKGKMKVQGGDYLQLAAEVHQLFNDIINHRVNIYK